MNKLFTFCFLLVLSLIFLASPALADDEIRNLQLDLKAKGFTQTDWQDNLQSNYIIFAPNDRFQVQLTIKNLGNRNQTQIKVRETLPSTVTTDSPTEFTIPQIAAGQDYVKTITITVKDKTYIYNYLANNSLRITAKSEVGTEVSDYTSFFTNQGTKSKSSESVVTTKGGLPDTGTTSTLLFGSAIASVLAFAGYKLRSFARGY